MKHGSSPTLLTTSPFPPSRNAPSGACTTMAPPSFPEHAPPTHDQRVAVLLLLAAMLYLRVVRHHVLRVDLESEVPLIVRQQDLLHALEVPRGALLWTSQGARGEA